MNLEVYDVRYLDGVWILLEMEMEMEAPVSVGHFMWIWILMAALMNCRSPQDFQSWMLQLKEKDTYMHFVAL